MLLPMYLSNNNAVISKNIKAPFTMKSKLTGHRLTDHWQQLANDNNSINSHPFFFSFKMPFHSDVAYITIGKKIHNFQFMPSLRTEQKLT